MSAKPSKVKPSKPVRRTWRTWRTWRDINDSVHRAFSQRPNPESLHPDADTVFASVSGSRTARAIVDAYAFRHPVTVVTDLEALCSQ
jgi:hypothetical protein